MDDAEEARKGPRARFGMARVSLRNLSFPEEGSIELIGHGRISTDLLDRLPSGILPELVRSWNTDASRKGFLLTTEEQQRAMFEDAEGAMLHWAADSLTNSDLPLSPDVSSAAGGLAQAIRCLKSGGKKDRQLFEKLLIYIMPDLRMPLRARDELDIELLEAVHLAGRRGRMPEIGQSTTWLLKEHRRLEAPYATFSDIRQLADIR